MSFVPTESVDESKTGFADLRFELGWDFLSDDDYHLGIGLQFAAPTGSKREATYVMQPVVGNGNHWELGGVVTGHYVFWRSDDADKHFGFYADANMMHLFKAEEIRTFDLKCKNNSRYMLAAKFKKVTEDTIVGCRESHQCGRKTSGEKYSCLC